ncbi:MAG: carbon-nitrogen hydrolase family protein, partial [Anaerotignum sp.]|nr:carbon-nitrogen hydrolase family protein [Anaerotignum sp.]
MKVSLLQMKTAATPAENIVKIREMLKQAKTEGADIAILPEMCCCPYENSAFVQFAMPWNSPFLTEMAEMAKEFGLYI